MSIEIQIIEQKMTIFDAIVEKKMMIVDAIVEKKNIRQYDAQNNEEETSRQK